MPPVGSESQPVFAAMPPGGSESPEATQDKSLVHDTVVRADAASRTVSASGCTDDGVAIPEVGAESTDPEVTPDSKFRCADATAGGGVDNQVASVENACAAP